MKRRVLLALGFALASGSALGDVGPPARNDCALLAPGSPCWADGKRAGACTFVSDAGRLACAAGVPPTRAVASAKPAPSAPPAPEPRLGCATFSVGTGGARPHATWLVLAGLASLCRRRTGRARSSG